jgi:uncharacterized protein YlzI (FlbEa/FlbD family)
MCIKCEQLKHKVREDLEDRLRDWSDTQVMQTARLVSEVSFLNYHEMPQIKTRSEAISLLSGVKYQIELTREEVYEHVAEVKERFRNIMEAVFTQRGEAVPKDLWN